MAKLYPPVIEGTIPAFSGTSIEVPFSMNRAVSTSEISGLVLKIKKINGTVIGTATTSILTSPASFSVAGFKLAQGEYYKVQLAYVDKFTKEIGYFSTVGVVKYTSTPSVFIEGLNAITSNSHNYIYTGVYRQAKYDTSKGIYDTSGYDTTEKLYSSRFYIYDENYNPIKDSGEILHSVNGDTSPYEAVDTFEYNDDFELDKSYYIQYEAITSNGMKVSTPRYKLSQRRLRPMVLNAHLEAKSDFETGTVKVYLVDDSNELASGLFLLSRASSRAPQKWESMKEFTLQSEYASRLLFTDYTVEQGITYKYSLQQYNEHGVYSERKISEEVIADFEDLFLYDGERQLTVRFNPKVATFKQNRVEQKTETIGSKYPYIIKNGAVNYKELSISGLISYQMDAIEQFMSKDELELPYNKHDNKRYNMRDLITDNIRAERLFKTEVLDWLNNGGIKLYRSPTEGNFIVRLMNVTTSPTDSLGRMLHTFNCSAYEMSEPTYDNLISFGILAPEDNTIQTMRWKTVDIRQAIIDNANSEKPKDYIQLNFGMNLGVNTELAVYTLDFEGMTPGSYFLLGEGPTASTKFYIGVTGTYHFVSEIPYSYVAIPAPRSKVKDASGNYPLLTDFNAENYSINEFSSLTFGYKGWVKSSFDLITNVQIIDQACHQFIGNAQTSLKSNNIMDYLTNIKESVLTVKYIKLFPREIKPLYFDEVNNLFYLTEKDSAHGGTSYTTSSLLSAVDKLALYKVYRVREKYYNVNNEDYYLDQSYAETPEYIVNNAYYLYYDPMRSHVGEEWYKTGAFIKSINDMELYNVTINNDSTNMFEVFSRTYRGINDVDYLSIGPGVIMEMGYQLQVSTYNFESEDYVLRNIKHNLDKQVQEYFNLKKTIPDIKNLSTENALVVSKEHAIKIDDKLKEIKRMREHYLFDLEAKVQSYKEENNLNE